MTDEKNNTGNSNTGYRNTGNWNTGYRNTGNSNTGNRNTGSWNTGNWNMGNSNTGNRNTGNSNTGNWNTGNSNTGNWNTGNWNTGYFNTTTPEMVQVFNSHLTNREAFITACPGWLFEPSPATWVEEADMSDQEKADNPTFQTCRGYLRTNDWHKEWRKAHANASAESIQKVRDLPGFNAEVFKEITGLDLSIEMPAQPEEIELNGVIYVRKQ